VLRSILEIVSPMFRKYCPTPKAEGNISQTEGKQFPIVTDKSLSVLLYLIAIRTRIRSVERGICPIAAVCMVLFYCLYLGP